MSRVTVKRFEKMSIKTILALTKKNAVHGRKISSFDFFKLCNNPTKPTPNSLHYTPRQYTLLLILTRNSSNSRKMTTFSVENNLVFYLSSLKLLDWFISSLQTSFRSCLVKGIVFFFPAIKLVGHSFIQIPKFCVFFFPRSGKKK